MAYRAALAFLGAAAAALSLFRLGSESLWLDEAFTWWFVRMPTLKMLEAVLADGVNPPLFYLADQVVTSVVGRGEAGLRFPSFVANLVALALAANIGHRMAGRAGALAAAWFWAFHPMAVWYAQDARPYALAAMLAAGLIGAFLKLREHNRTRNWISAGVMLSLGLLTHYFFFVLAGSLSLWSLLEIRTRPLFFRRWTLLMLIAMLPLGLWLNAYFAQPSPRLGIGWILAPDPTDIGLTLWNLVSGFGGSAGWAPLAFGGLVAGLLGAAWAKPSNRIVLRNSLVAGLLLPLVGVWAVSQRRPVYIDRYFIVLLPIIVLPVALGSQAAWGWLARQGRTTRWSLLCGAVLILTGASNGLRIHTDSAFTREDWQTAVQLVEASEARLDSLYLSEPELALPLAYYGLELPAIRLLDEFEACPQACWWIQRQPYTATHAFSQAIADPRRPWVASTPSACRTISLWMSETGLAAQHLECP